MKLLRICITSILSIWAPKFGGGPVLAHHLANGLHQRNYDVRVVYTKPSRQPNTTPDYPVSWVHHSDHIITNLLPIIWGVSCLANEQRFDIYHATGVEGFFIASWPGRKSPFVYSEYYPELPILTNLKQGSWITALKNLFR